MNLIGIHPAGVGSARFVLSLSWLSNVTAGHSKRVTVNAVMLSAYCIGNSVGPFMWQQKYKPRLAGLGEIALHLFRVCKISSNIFRYRNHVPWIIIGICNVLCMTLLLTIRYVLSSENKRRDNEPIDNTYDDVYMKKVGKDGQTERIKVDKVTCEVDLNITTSSLTRSF